MTSCPSAAVEPGGAASTDLSSISPDELVGLLDERAPCYAGMDTAFAERSRAAVMAVLAQRGLAQLAILHILEDLATAERPYPLASAARAIRSLDAIPAEAVPLLIGALDRIAPRDDPVALDPDTPGNLSTASGELIDALEASGAAGADALRSWCEGPSAALVPKRITEDARSAVENTRPSKTTSCCGHVHTPASDATEEARHPGLLTQLVEDQHGRRCELGTLAGKRRIVLAFFYTRCMNPQMCSATVERLGALHREILSAGLDGDAVVVGMTYDPAFDTSPHLLRYGLDRGLTFGDGLSLVRTVGTLEPFEQALSLGVGYGPVTVNRHRLELHVIGPDGSVEASVTRRTWTPQEMVSLLGRDQSP